MPAIDPGEYPGLSLEALLDEVASPAPAPAGGSVAAVATALAAALCSMALRKSPAFPGDARGLLHSAEARRARALSLASEDAVAYKRVLDAQKLAAALEKVEPALETPLLATALRAAADVPFELVGIAAEVAGIAGELVAGGNPNLVGDSLTAALLAAAAAEAAAGLVAIDLDNRSTGSPGEDLVERAAVLAGQAAWAAAAARSSAQARLSQQ
jgi:formiminotetrahydrofolate cyclodeaminase